MKASPTSWVMQFKAGKVKRQGAGLSFFYWGPTTTLVMVPLASADVPFCFTEITADFQTVTVQGQLTWRVADPARVASLLDFTVTPTGTWTSEDPRKLPERLVHQAQILTRTSTERWSLKEVLTRGEALSREVLSGLRGAEALTMLGVEVLSLSILAVRPTPEMARALEAEAREGLQRRSDEAIYERRNAAVEQERRIKQSELETEVMTEQQRRHIRETKMQADIALEHEREKLVEQKAANDKKAAEADAWALDATLKPIRTLDWKVLSALSTAGSEPGAMIAVAFRELAENAHKIGELNVSPDLLRSLVPARREK
jgi:regulator of protease activity HflC (stomatin/prohibitin superfamily)